MRQCARISVKGAPKNTLTPATLITFGVSLLTGAITSVQCWRDPRPRWHVLCANSSTVLYASDLSKNSRKFEVRKTNSGDELHTWDKNTGSYFVNGKWLVTEYRGVLDITPLWIGGQRREHLRVTDSFWFSHVRLSSNHAMPDEAVVGNFQYFFGLNSGFGTKLIVLDIARSWASGQFIELSSTTTKWHTQQWRYTDLLLLTQQSGDRCFIMGVKTGPDASVTIIAEGTGTAIPLVYHHPREVIDGIHQLSGSTFCVISGRSGRKERALTMWCDIWDCNNTSGALRSIELEQPIAVESLFAEGGLLFTVRTAQLSGNHVVQVTDPSSSGPPILCFTLPYRASVYHFSLLT
ncbi:hypothetical protein Pelo_4626 [Pelomyxa schiedti]|nr:hypothetical protein Pelo_4626 [Pelomyxa schiedti]